MNCSVLFYSCPQQAEHPHLPLHRPTSPITSWPWLAFFPLCWAQCSFLAANSFITALLAYLSPPETKHGFIWWFALSRGRGIILWRISSPCAARRARLITGELYLLAESWPLCWGCLVCWRDTEGEDGGWWGFFSSLLISYSFFSHSPSARGQFVCWHRRVFYVCFHTCLFYAPALLLHECSEALGSAGANEMYHWPHNPAALNTLLCVHTAADLKHTPNLSLPQTCVWNL